MNQNDSAWRSFLSRDIVVKVFMALSALALLTGARPTDTAMHLYIQQSQRFTEDAALVAASIKTYSAMVFIIPATLCILACGTRYAIMSGVMSYLLFLGVSIQQAVPELTRLGSVFAGYAAATWIACSCCGRYVLKEDRYLFYYASIVSYHLVGQCVSTIFDAIVLGSIVGVPTVFYLAIGTGTLNLSICFFGSPRSSMCAFPKGRSTQWQAPGHDVLGHVKTGLTCDPH